MLVPGADSFGYTQQLLFYDRNAPQLPSYPQYLDSFRPGEFLFIDKQLGKMVSKTYAAPVSFDYRLDKGGEEFAQEMQHEEPPPRAYTEIVEIGGNKRLGTACSYCAFKETCWPGLRAFKYSTGPKFLTAVNKMPQVYEIPMKGAKIAA